jgi:hypothetical protein
MADFFADVANIRAGFDGRCGAGSEFLTELLRAAGPRPSNRLLPYARQYAPRPVLYILPALKDGDSYCAQAWH